MIHKNLGKEGRAGGAREESIIIIIIKMPGGDFITLIGNVVNYVGLFYFSKVQVVSYISSQVLFQLAVRILGE